MLAADIDDYNTKRNISKAKMVMNEIEKNCRKRGVLGESEDIMPHNLAECNRRGSRVDRTMEPTQAFGYSYITYRIRTVQWESQCSRGQPLNLMNTVTAGRVEAITQVGMGAIQIIV